MKNEENGFIFENVAICGVPCKRVVLSAEGLTIERESNGKMITEKISTNGEKMGG